MPRTIQIRNIDDKVYAALSKRAAEVGLSVPDLLRREAARLASRPTSEERLERTRHRPGTTRSDVLEALDEMRGPWPDVGR